MDDNNAASENQPKPGVLIVGGGIAGMQAALEVADSGHQVYLVEKSPTVGGRMLQLDKTFPTLDCASCIGSPKTSQVGSHPNINLLTCSEVLNVSGYAGNFTISVRKNAKYVDISNCTACGECANVCPVSVPREWDMGMSLRKAAYRPYPQAVPNVFTIDKRGIPPCRATCPAGVNAQGYIALISQGKFREALGVLRRTMPFAGVCGRVCTHPCEAECERGKVDAPVSIRFLKRFMADYEAKDGRENATPCEITKEDKVAIVGSGPAGIACAYDLVQLGYPVTVFEAAPEAGGLLRYGIPEYRLPNAVVDDEIGYVLEMGVELKTNTPVNDIDELTGQGYKAVFLATGAWSSQKMGIPGEDSDGVLLGLEFLRTANGGEKVAIGKKVVVVGGGNAAIDAARVANRSGAGEVTLVYRRSRVEMPAAAEEVDAAEEEGINIDILTNPVEVIASGGKVTAIKCVKMELGEPDESGRRRPVVVEGSEFEIPVDTVIMGIGQTVDKDKQPAGLEYTERGTLAVNEVTKQTNKADVFAGGDVVSGPADVIHAVAAAKEAAISIDRYLSGEDMETGRGVKRERVKEVNREGAVRQERAAMPEILVEERKGFAEVETGFDEETAVAEAGRCLNCGVCSECFACLDVCERMCIHHDMQDEYVDLEVGAIILATGYDLFDPSLIKRYGYGKYDNVITSLEAERFISSTGPTEGQVLLKDGSKPEAAAIIHCVGSRDENYHEYCSRVCCMHGLKQAHQIKEKTGGTVYQMYIDMRCFGKGYEEFYKRISDEGIIFIRGKVAQVTDVVQDEEQPGKLIVVCEDTLNDTIIRVPVDLVVLNVALQPRADAAEVAELFSIKQDKDGFFEEQHYMVDPMGTLTDGIYLAGCCQGPKDIPDSVAQAIGAAGKALALVTRGEVGYMPGVEVAAGE